MGPRSGGHIGFIEKPSECFDKLSRQTGSGAHWRPFGDRYDMVRRPLMLLPSNTDRACPFTASVVWADLFVCLEVGQYLGSSRFQSNYLSPDPVFLCDRSRDVLIVHQRGDLGLEGT
jgi:hypothetical protein